MVSDRADRIGASDGESGFRQRGLGVVGLINPNTTLSMTKTMVSVARAAARGRVEVVGLTPRRGPSTIESYVDEVFAAAEVVRTVRTHNECGAFVIGCASDPGIHAAREATERPVVGIGEAAFLMACTLGRRFGVITTLSRAVDGVWAQIGDYGLSTRCAAVRSIGIDVGSICQGSGDMRDALETAAQDLLLAGAEVLVLGCGALSHERGLLEKQVGVPVVDGVEAAVVVTEGLLRLGLTTSKGRSYAPSEPIAYA